MHFWGVVCVCVCDGGSVGAIGFSFWVICFYGPDDEVFFKLQTK